MTEASQPRDPKAILSEIKAKTQIMLRLRKNRDDGKFRSIRAALGLQKIEQEIKQLRAELPPLTLIQ